MALKNRSEAGWDSERRTRFPASYEFDSHRRPWSCIFNNWSRLGTREISALVKKILITDFLPKFSSINANITPKSIKTHFFLSFVILMNVVYADQSGKQDLQHMPANHKQELL